MKTRTTGEGEKAWRMGWDQVLGGRDGAGRAVWQHNWVKCSLDSGLSVLFLYIKKMTGNLLPRKGWKRGTRRKARRGAFHDSAYACLLMDTNTLLKPNILIVVAYLAKLECRVANRTS